MRELEGLQGAVHGSRLAKAEWTAIEALYERVWPGMPARLRHAEALGARWADCTTPFTWFERGRALATVGVLAHPVRLAGQDRVVGGIHSVATDPDARRRGLCGQLLRAAIAWAEPQLPLLELSTASPDVYRSAGFRLQPTHRFAVPASARGARVSLRPMDLDDPDDLALARRRLGERAPVSNVYASREPGWMTLIDAALAQVTASWFYDAADLDATIVAARTAEGWVVHDVIAAQLPARLPALDGDLALAFAPDLLAPDATPIAVPEEFMVRGAWPDLAPLGVPALWEH